MESSCPECLIDQWELVDPSQYVTPDSNSNGAPNLTFQNNKGYIHTFKIRATAEGGASLLTDIITITINCDIIRSNYTTVYNFAATEKNDSPLSWIDFSPFAMTTGTDRCAPKEHTFVELGNGTENVISSPGKG